MGANPVLYGNDSVTLYSRRKSNLILPSAVFSLWVTAETSYQDAGVIVPALVNTLKSIVKSRGGE